MRKWIPPMLLALTACRTAEPPVPSVRPQAPLVDEEPPEQVLDKPKFSLPAEDLPPGALRRLGSGRLVGWDPPKALGFACGGDCIISAGSWLESNWDTKSGRLVWSTNRGKMIAPAVAGPHARYFSEFDSFESGGDVVGYLPEVDPDSLDCPADPARIEADEAECDANEYCDSLPYDPDDPLFLEDQVIAADSSRVAATFTCYGEEQRRIGIFDVADETQLTPSVLRPDGGPDRERGTSIALSADGRRLAFSKGSSWRIVDLDEDQLLVEIAAPDLVGYLTAKFAPDGAHLAVVDEGDISIYSVPEGKEVFRVRGVPSKCRVPAYDRQYENASVAFGDNGRIVVSQADGRVQVVELETGTVEYEVKICATAAALSPDGNHLVVGTRRSTEPVHYVLPSTEPRVPAFVDAAPRRAKAVALSADGRIAASMVSDATVWVWDVATGAVLHRLERASGGTQIAASVALSPSGTRLASAQQIASLWDVQTGAHIVDLESSFHSWGLDRFVFSPQGSQLAAASLVIEIWDAETGRRQHKFEFPDRPSLALVFLEEGRILAADQKHVHLIDSRKGTILHTLPLPGKPCGGWCSTTRPSLRRVDSRVLFADGGHDNPRSIWIQRAGERLSTASAAVADLTLPTPPASPSAVAPNAALAVTADPRSTALLVWPYPWPLPVAD